LFVSYLCPFFLDTFFDEDFISENRKIFQKIVDKQPPQRAHKKKTTIFETMPIAFMTKLGYIYG